MCNGGETAMNRLANRTALVTGAGSGIGLAVARVFLEEGARVALVGRDEAKLRRAAHDLAAGDRAGWFPADVGDEGQVERCVGQVRDHFGGIDVLVNNAGLNVKRRAFRELTSEDWRRMRSANLDGAYYVTRAVFPQMAERRDGVIVFISSVAGRRVVGVSGPGYSASKFGMSALGLCLAAEERESGVRVSVIYPGEVDTPILEQRPRPLDAEYRRHILKPQDVAAAVLFVVTLPPHVSVPELVIQPARQPLG
jgi:NADP-dependent 3-hydroxy acid dehydrogenase YdfG